MSPEPMYAWTCEQWGHDGNCTIGNCDCTCHAEEVDGPGHLQGDRGRMIPGRNGDPT